MILPKLKADPIVKIAAKDIITEHFMLIAISGLWDVPVHNGWRGYVKIGHFFTYYLVFKGLD